MTDWTPLDSSNLRRVSYDPAGGTMQIQFQSGSTYQYHGVDQSDHDALVNADSPGKHFATAIKGQFRATPV